MNQGFEYRERVGGDSRGCGVLDYLVRRYRHSTAAEWRERIESGQVRVDGDRVEARATLRAGQLLAWRRPPWREARVPRDFGIVYRDADVLALDKPAGLPTLPGGGFLENTMLHLVRGEDPDATPVHRLGRWTSGLLLFARTRTARVELARAWRAGQVRKEYRALASGRPRVASFTVETPIGRVPHRRLGTVHAASREGVPALSHVRLLERRAGAFLAQVEPVTGRPHQIRIHLAAAGHPLLGDPLYAAGGVPGPECSALPGDPGYRLHSLRLRLRHPRSGEELDLGCAPPPGLERAGGGV